MTIHKEGRNIIALLFFILDLVGFLTWFYLGMPWAIPVWIACFIIFVLVLQFFRSPHVNVTQGDNFILAPADGKVVAIEDTVETEYFNDKRKQISIFMSPFNVHVNRAPVSGLVTLFKYHPGKYMVAWHPKSSTENERTTMVMKTENGTEILVRQIAGAVARRIKWYVSENNNLERGQEFGFIKFGSRVDIFVPHNVEIRVQPGEATKGGRTILAEFKREVAEPSE